MAIILLEPSFGGRHASGNPERLGNKRRKALHEDPGDKCDQHEVYIRVDSSNRGAKPLEIEPGRIFKIGKELSQRLRRTGKDLVVLLDASFDEPVEETRMQRGEFLHHCVEFRVTNCRMREIVVDSCMVRETRSCIVPSIAACGKSHSIKIPALGYALDSSNHNML